MNKFVFILLFTIPFLGTFIKVNSVPLPSNKYYYMLARNEIRDMETKFQNIKKLSAHEKIVHFYLEHLKELENTETQDRFLPSIPIEEVRDEIMNRPLYQFMRILPKGGNLHMHEPEMLDRKVLLEMIASDFELFEMLYICDRPAKAEYCMEHKLVCNCSAHQLKYFAKSNPGDAWVKVMCVLERLLI